MSYEIWTKQRYGSSFGQPETKLQDGLDAAGVATELRRDHGMLLHNLLVVFGAGWTLASKWLAAYEKEQV